MTNEQITKLHDELIRLADHCTKLAAQRALFGDGVDGAEDDGRAKAYRHAAELLHAAMEKGG